MTSRLLQPGSVYARTREPNVRTVEAPAAILRYNLIPRHDCVSTRSVLAHKRLVSGCRQRRASNLHPRLISSFVSLLPRARRGMAQRLALRQQICPVRHGAQISSRHWTRQAWSRASAPTALCIGEFEPEHAQLLTTTTSLLRSRRTRAKTSRIRCRLWPVGLAQLFWIAALRRKQRN